MIQIQFIICMISLIRLIQRSTLVAHDSTTLTGAAPSTPTQRTSTQLTRPPHGASTTARAEGGGPERPPRSAPEVPSGAEVDRVTWGDHLGSGEESSFELPKATVGRFENKGAD